MGEIIQRPIPAVAFPFTGERLTSGITGQTEIEHIHRYLWARAYCRGKDVLDVAAGEGYGSALIAQVARSVTGVDIAADVIAHAKQSYQQNNLRYVQGDARDIPLPDASVDVVVSFETIEHFAEHERFLAEIRRVLRPGGAVLISTPDRDNYSPADSPANPYHVFEQTTEEFARSLEAHFQHVRILLQRPVYGSLMLPDASGSKTSLCFEKRGERHFEASLGLSRPQYVVAIASDVESLRPDGSVYIESSKLSYHSPQEYAALLEAATKKLDDERKRFETEIESLRNGSQNELRAAKSELSELEALLAERDQDLRTCREQLVATQTAGNQTDQHTPEAERLRTELQKALASAAEKDERLAGINTTLHVIDAEIEASRQLVKRLQQNALANEIALQELRERVRSEQRSAEALNALISRSDAEFRELTALRMAELQQQISDSQISVQQLAAQRDAQDSEFRDLQQRYDGIQISFQALLESTSWKATWPLRWVAYRTPGARPVVRRLLKATWWTITLQLPGKLREFLYWRLLNTRLIPANQVVSIGEQAERISHEFDEAKESQTSNVIDSEASAAVEAEVSSPKPEASASGVFESAPANWSRPLAVVVDHKYPNPTRDSGSVDAVNYVRFFQAFGYQVAFIADAEPGNRVEGRALLEKMGVFCAVPPHYEDAGAFLSANGGSIDVCCLFRVSHGGRWIEAARRMSPQAKIVFSASDLHHIRETRFARLRNDRIALVEAMRTRERELSVVRRADVSITPSHQEKAWLDEAVPGANVIVLPLVRDVPGRRNGFNERSGIAFLGGYAHQPNVDAVLHFLDHIWPRIHAELPDASFYAIGADLPMEIASRQDSGFVPTGYVEDLQPVLEKIRVLVAPLRYGAGSKGKLVTAMTHALPCVCAPIAAEGMSIEGAILVAETDEEFHRKVVSLYKDETRWYELSDAALRTAQASHSLEFGLACFGEMLGVIGAPLPRLAAPFSAAKFGAAASFQVASDPVS